MFAPRDAALFMVIAMGSLSDGGGYSGRVPSVTLMSGIDTS